jgi:hypothetical protein
MKKKILKITIALALAGYIFGMGFWAGQPNQPEPVVITETVKEYVPQIEYQAITETKYIEQIVEVPVEVIKTKYKSLTQFESVEQMTDWYDNNDYLEITMIDNELSLQGKLDDRNDCDDQAMRLRDRAARDGYDLDLQVVYRGKLMNIRVTSITEPHMGCITIVGNDVWYLDVMNDKPVKVCELD